MADTMGVLGVGKVGSAVARRIAESGYDLRLYNRTTSAAEVVARSIGGIVVSSPASLTGDCDIIWGCLAGWDAVADCYLGKDGVLSASPPGARVFVELGTLEPWQVQRLEHEVTAAGHEFVYAAITGRPMDIEQGRAFILASGKAVPAAEPILSRLGSVHHVSDTAGDAAVMKLAVNMMIFASLCSAGEALNLAGKAGIDRSRALDLLLLSPVGSTILQLRRDFFLDPVGRPVQSTIDLTLKNFGLMSELADRVGAHIPQTQATAAVFANARDAGYGSHDSTGIAQYIAERQIAQPSGAAPSTAEQPTAFPRSSSDPHAP